MKIPSDKQTRGTPRLQLVLWVLALLLVACAPVQLPASESEPEVLATETAIIEEEPIEEVTPTPVSEGESVTSSGLTVGVIVVDFFGSGEEEGGGSSTNCLISPSGSYSEGEGGGHGSTGATDGLITTNVEHGKLVYAHLKQMFGENLFAEVPLAGVVPGLILVESAELPEGKVYLAQVDIGENFTDNVLLQIEGVRNELMAAGASYIVVNMSVVIKPCDNVIIDSDNPAQYIQFVQCIEALKATQDYFNELGFSNEVADAFLKPHAEVAAAYYVSPLTREPWGCPGDPNADGVADTLEQIIGRSFAFVSNLPEDPLFNAIQNSGERWPENNTFFIAASGNDGYSYPYAPAIFLDVVSTGAYDSFPSFGYVPNNAEWVEGGAFEWVLPEGATAVLTSTQGIIELQAGDPVTFSGTSFAAPKMSYLTTMAIFRGADIPSCYPLMVYAADKLPQDWFSWVDLDDAITLPEELEALYDDIWANQTVDLLSCPGFLP